MADELLNVLARFQVALPDIERIVADAVQSLALRDEMLSHFDAIYKRFDHVEGQYEATEGGSPAAGGTSRGNRREAGPNGSTIRTRHA